MIVSSYNVYLLNVLDVIISLLWNFFGLMSISCKKACVSYDTTSHNEEKAAKEAGEEKRQQEEKRRDNNKKSRGKLNNKARER